MRTIEFFKYQGTGNDFILIDHREPDDSLSWDAPLVALLCDRRFGIGADGLMLLQSVEGHDFEMVYFNADGRRSTLCGNGGRCIASFAHRLGVVGAECRFLAADGPHTARIDSATGWVELGMADVHGPEAWEGRILVDTGSPHCVEFRTGLADFDVVEEGSAIRYGARFRDHGINVNFVEQTPDGALFVATYERGVENETLSCGTGVTAAAVAWMHRHDTRKTGEPKTLPIRTKGGELTVRLRALPDGTYRDIRLGGPATLVFSGQFPR